MGIGRYVSIIHMLKFDYFKYKYKRVNQHNTTIPGNYFDIGKVSVGRNTYGTIYVVDYSSCDTTLSIGAYCSISAGVQFILGGEHNIDTISTYPFKVCRWGENKEAGSRGNIVVGSDVWIGQNALIMSGVTIGQGAIIGAGSIVTSDVEPYAVVVGVPAKQIRKRLPDNLIQKLVEIDIDKLFDTFTEQDKPLIYSSNEGDILKLLDKYRDRI